MKRLKLYGRLIRDGYNGVIRAIKRIESFYTTEEIKNDIYCPTIYHTKIYDICDFKDIQSTNMKNKSHNYISEFIKENQLDNKDIGKISKRFFNDDERKKLCVELSCVEYQGFNKFIKNIYLTPCPENH